MKDPRMVSRNVNPFDRAESTLVSLYGDLEAYFKLYAQRPHPAFGMSPDEMEASLFRTTGRRQHTLVRFDENIMLLTCPHTKRFFHQVDPRRGIQTFGKFYWHPAFREFPKKKKVEVRVEPWCANVLYVCVKGRWVTAVARELAQYLGRTSREVQQTLREAARARYTAAKNALISPEILVKKTELFSPLIFDPRMASQQSETTFLAKLLGLGVASSSTCKLIEHIEADCKNSPFEETPIPDSMLAPAVKVIEMEDEDINLVPQVYGTTRRAMEHYL
ncbi:hypothetical protein AU476_12695 [Cupriavidus sp. UYMSc13B]|nr:hypothetical protein AU476_12695 [Cupriavidus sp. UYMSc13B]